MKEIIFFLLIVVITYGCKNDYYNDWSTEDLPHYEMDEEFRRFFKPANAGSMYIYQDSVNGEIDTMILASIRELIGTVGDDFTGEGYDLFYESTKSANFRSRLRTYPDFSNHDNSYPFGAGAYCNNKMGTFNPEELVSRDDRVSVNGTVYEDVLKLETEGQFFEEFWFAKDIGIIYKKASSTTGAGHYYLIEYRLK